MAYVFPGQGSQYVGMGADLYQNYASARAVFDQADQALGMPLSRLCFEGPEDELTQTINAQPAIVTVSIACLEAVREATPDTLQPASFVAGHSIGEYTALVAAGVVNFPAAVRLARQRGRLMHEAGLSTPGTMAAVIGLHEDQLAEICEQAGTWIANVNSPGQIVISGEVQNVSKATELAKSAGAKLVIPLAVSGAFHTPLMQEAAEGMSMLIAKQPMAAPKIPIVGNTRAQVLDSAESVRAELQEQLCSGVQWQGCIEFLISQAVSTFIEIGPDDVLSGLIAKINDAVSTENVGDVLTISSRS